MRHMPRLCQYTALVESIDNYRPDQEKDVELFQRLELLDLQRNIFPLLKKVTLHPVGTEFWFPLGFRNNLVKDLSIEAPTVPRGSMRDVFRYCTMLERLVIVGSLHESDMDLLQDHRFVYLTSLYIRLDDVRLDESLQTILSISHNLTDLTLIFPKRSFSATTKRGPAFKSVQTLKMDGLDPVASNLKHFPSAPRLQSLTLTSCNSDMQSETDLNALFLALGDYNTRSPFTALVIQSGPVSPQVNVRIDLLKLSYIEHLTHLSFTASFDAKLAFPDQLGIMAWPRLRTLTLITGGFQYPAISLFDIFCLASTAPLLQSVTALVDFRMQSNPGLVSRAPDKAPPFNDDGDNKLQVPYTLREDIAQYRTTSLRTLDFRSSFLLQYDQMFLFTILRELAPNVGISARMLGTLTWANQGTRKAVMSYAKRTRPSTSDFILFLSQRPL